MKHVLPLVALLALFALVVLWPSDSAAEPQEAWSHAYPATQAKVRAGKPLVVRVIVPLCDNAQINCGQHGLGNPLSLRTNLYWGALFGAVRFFDRPEAGYQLLSKSGDVPGLLERRVYRRHAEGAAWGLAKSEVVEQIVILDAVHGARINDAVSGFWQTAAKGSRIEVDGDKQRRTLTVDAVGYAGHNRLMDGVRLLPSEKEISADRAAIASFALACYSDRYFSEPLRAAGSTPLVTTTAYMAPEGYAIEAAVRALGDNTSGVEMRRRVVAAYAKWQRISDRQASRLFASE